jgi:hypothetical protein
MVHEREPLPSRSRGGQLTGTCLDGSPLATPLPPLAEHLPPELALLTVLDRPIAVDALVECVDWAVMTGLARHHRLSGQLATAVQERAGERGPLGTIAARLVQERDLRQARYDEEVLPQLDEMSQALGSVTIVPTLLKGVALVATGVCPAGERPMADIDMLVEPSSVDAATSALLRLGYESRAAAAERRWARHHHYQDPAWHHPSWPLPIEVHWGLQVPAHRLHFDPASLRRSDVALPSRVVRCLAPLDQLTHLALHFWHDRSYGLSGALGQLWDVRRCSPAADDARWSQVRHLALLRGHAQVLAAVLACSHLLLGGPSPARFPEVEDLVRDERCVSFAIRRVLAQRPPHIQLTMVTPDVHYRPGRMLLRIGSQFSRPLPLLRETYRGVPPHRVRLHHTRALLGLLRELVGSPVDSYAEFELDRWAHELT